MRNLTRNSYLLFKRNEIRNKERGVRCLHVIPHCKYCGLSYIICIKIQSNLIVKLNVIIYYIWHRMVIKTCFQCIDTTEFDKFVQNNCLYGVNKTHIEGVLRQRADNNADNDHKHTWVGNKLMKSKRDKSRGLQSGITPYSAERVKTAIMVPPEGVWQGKWIV